MVRFRTGKILVIVILLVAAGAIAALLVLKNRAPKNPPIAELPATKPTTAPASRPTSAPVPVAPKDLLGVVRAANSDYPTTQELEFPANYDQAAHLVIDEPVYLCPAGHLWITHPRGQETSAVLAKLGDANSHVVRDRIVFAHWQSGDAGKWNVSLVRKNPAGGFDLVQAKRTTPLSPARNWKWDRALMWEDKIVVPTDRGVSVINVNDPTAEQYQPLVDDSADASKLTTPSILFDTRGVIAWMPWKMEAGLTGSSGAARFADGKWTRLDASQVWPEKILQLMPLLDGSILQLVANDDGGVTLQMSGVARSEVKVDESDIMPFVNQLSDPDQKTRDAGYEQLTRYGPGIFPILQKIRDDQPPAAQSRIDELLKSKVRLTLGPITLEPGKIRTAYRLRDGGVVLYCDNGVSVARGSNENPTMVAPAWLSIRPGYAVQVLPPKLFADLQIERTKLWAFKSEWVVGDEVEGLRWFVGNYLSPLQRKDEKQFSEFVGIDNHGRWVMRSPKPDGPTLIVDTNLPDTTPRLPVWVYVQKDGNVGWTNTNWPAVKLKDANEPAVLGASGWRVVEKGEVFVTQMSDMPTPATAPPTAPPIAPSISPTSSPTTAPTSGPTTTASTQPTTQEAPDLLLIDKDGTRYYDGSSAIRVGTKDGTETTWNLPPTASGTGDVWLFHCGDDRLFLFNQPGRVLRLRRTPTGAEPFKLEATFTHNIPNVDNQNTWIDRIWLDPAGRLIISTTGNTLSILFPSGQVPQEIRQMMPPEKAGE